MRLQYTHRGTHYERMLRRWHGIGINVKELIVVLVTAADAMSLVLACVSMLSTVAVALATAGLIEAAVTAAAAVAAAFALLLASLAALAVSVALTQRRR